MKIEKAQADFERLINKHSFTVAAHTIDSGIPVYGCKNSRCISVFNRRIPQNDSYD